MSRRRQRGTAALLVALVAGLGLASVSSSARSGVPTCSAAELGAWGGPSSGAAGTILTEFAFVNTGTRKCSLIGYPRLQMENSAGGDISTTDEHAPAGFDGIRRKLVIIAPGKRAYFGAAYPDSTGAGNKVCPTSTQLALTPPGASAPVTLAGSAAAITPFAGSRTGIGCGIVQLTLVSAKRLF